MIKKKSENSCRTRGQEKDVELQEKKRAASGPEARKKDVELQVKRRRNKKGDDSRQAEYRRRTDLRRQKRAKLSHEPLHFWTSNAVPSDSQLLNFEKDPGSAVAMFRLMAGLPTFDGQRLLRFQ